MDFDKFLFKLPGWRFVTESDRAPILTYFHVRISDSGVT